MIEITNWVGRIQKLMMKLIDFDDEQIDKLLIKLIFNLTL